MYQGSTHLAKCFVGRSPITHISRCLGVRCGSQSREGEEGRCDQSWGKLQPVATIENNHQSAHGTALICIAHCTLCTLDIAHCALCNHALHTIALCTAEYSVKQCIGIEKNDQSSAGAVLGLRRSTLPESAIINLT